MTDPSTPEMPAPAVYPDKWESFWDKNSGRLVKPFKFGPLSPPADAPFTTAVPAQFRPLDATEYGADLNRLQQLVKPAGFADPAPTKGTGE